MISAMGVVSNDDIIFNLYIVTGTKEMSFTILIWVIVQLLISIKSMQLIEGKFSGVWSPVLPLSQKDHFQFQHS